MTAAAPSDHRTAEVAVAADDTNLISGYLAGVSAFLTDRWNTPAHATGLAKVAGGNARTTWRCDVTADGTTHGTILRVEAGPELHLSGLRRECDVQRVAHDAGLPVPRPLFYESDRAWLGAPFALIDEVPAALTSVNGRHLAPDVQQRFGVQMWTVLGQLAALSVDDMDIPSTIERTSTRTCAAEQLGYWEDVYRRHELHPHPVADAAIDWLQAADKPTADKLALVHADYRTGNLLHDEAGNVQAVIDWEMAHLGDPLEDLAWSLDARQDANFPELAGGLVPHAEAVAAWQRSSGLAIDPDAFRWWQVLCAFKALAIWTISANHFRLGTSKRAVDGRIGWLLAERQHRILVDLLSPTSRHIYYRYAR